MGCVLAAPLVALWRVEAFYWGIVGALLGSLGVVYPCDLLRSRRLCTFAPANRQRGLCRSLHNGPIAQLV